MPKVLLYTVGRSGSQYVSHLLQSNCSIEIDEWFNPEWPKESASKEEFLVYLKTRLLDHADPFSAKITPHLFDPYWTECEPLISDFLDTSTNVKNIFLYRYDFWSLCQSYWNALNTGKWHSSFPQSDPIPTSFPDIVENIYKSEEKMISLYLSKCPLKPPSIAYEQLLMAPSSFAYSLLNAVEPRFNSSRDITIENMPQKLLTIKPLGADDLFISLSENELSHFRIIKAKRDKRLIEFLSLTSPL